MAAAKLSEDLTRFVSEPVELFRADDPAWATGKVTDGCWMVRLTTGELLMLWSNWDSAGYCVGIARSDNGRVDGKNYREFLLFRLDGENWEDDDQTENRFQISHTRNFVSWDAWKEINKQGIDCEVTIRRSGSRIICSTENLGIAITSVTTIKDNVSDLYAALTGDQCALTNIHVKK